MNKRYLLYTILKKFFLITSENENPELYKYGGRSTMLQIFPRGKVQVLQCCKPSPLGEGLHNVADLPGEGLQCCRSSGGKVCKGSASRGEVCKGEGLQYNTGPSSTRAPGRLMTYVFSLLVVGGPARDKGTPGIEP